ncbi:hypothetical protein Tco_1021038 [Tanacetum coccineum]
MNPVVAKQVALDNSLVLSEKRLKIEKCNARIEFSKPQREETYKVTLDALKLSPCYPAFLITTKVPEICPRLPNQAFVEPPSEEELVTFIQELGYSGKCISGKITGLDRLRESRAQIFWGMYNKKNVDYVALLWEDFMYEADNREISSARKQHMPYPRITKVIISHFISKDNTMSMRNMINLHTIHDDSLLGTLKFETLPTYCLMTIYTLAQIRRIFLDGYGVLVVRTVIFKISLFKLQNACLLLIFTKYSEDFMYQADNREISSARKEHMPYPRFAKGIISHFISKDKTISMRNKINLHTIRDDTLLDIKDSKAYKTYYDFATRKATSKKVRKYKKVASPLRKLTPVLEDEPTEKPKQAKKPAKKFSTVRTTGVAIIDTPSESVPKKKTPSKVDRGKGMDLFSDVALLEYVSQFRKLYVRNT